MTSADGFHHQNTSGASAWQISHSLDDAREQGIVIVLAERWKSAIERGNRRAAAGIASPKRASEIASFLRKCSSRQNKS